MKLSTKGRYAMVALADLALAHGDELRSLAEISRRQDISLPYLEQLFVSCAAPVWSRRCGGRGAAIVWPASPRIFGWPM